MELFVVTDRRGFSPPVGLRLRLTAERALDLGALVAPDPDAPGAVVVRARFDLKRGNVFEADPALMPKGAGAAVALLASPQPAPAPAPAPAPSAALAEELAKVKPKAKRALKSDAPPATEAELEAALDAMGAEVV